MADFRIKDLSFAYSINEEKQVLKNIDFEIKQGEYIAVCGKSGSGKTTLLRHFKTCLTPSGIKEGNIYFNNKELNEIPLKDQASFIGYVMQNPDSQIVTDKVKSELAFGLENLGVDHELIRLRVAEMSSYFGINDWLEYDVSSLSGGQKQLLNLASIMAMQPSVLILDEPTSQLDPIAASEFLNTVKKINQELRTTIIISEHRLEDVIPNADKVLVMDSGEIIAYDSPRNIGQYLKDANNDNFEAMPTPVRVFYGIDKKCKEGYSCPLTVREGGDFLTNIIGYTDNLIPKLEDNNIKSFDYDDLALEVKNIWFRYSRESRDILNGCSIKVPRGTILSILGGNGSGKTTLLKAICGVLKPYRGKINVNEKVAMLPQDPQSLFSFETVKEELLEMSNDYEEIAKLCEIEDILSCHPYDISGGEQQRVALAKVLLLNPSILLLDEPTKGLDNFFKTKLASILKELKERGVTIVLVSHDVEFSARYADLCTMFFNGEAVSTSEPNKFFSENSFYTTAANRMSRHLFINCINCEDVIKLCQRNLS